MARLFLLCLLIHLFSFASGINVATKECPSDIQCPDGEYLDGITCSCQPIATSKCPCPRLVKTCDDGSVIAAECSRNEKGVCVTSWPRCPASHSHPHIGPHASKFESQDASSSAVVCACPDLIKLCPDGVTSSRPICGPDASGNCQITWTPCPAPPVVCACPDLAILCPDHMTVSTPVCDYNWSTQQCETNWTPCPPIICECPNLPIVTCPDGVTESTGTCFYNDTAQECQTSYSECPPEPVSCPCIITVMKVCPGGAPAHPICTLDSNGICQVNWEPCPIIDPVPCPCPNIIRVCPCGGDVTPLCFRNPTTGVCQVEWPDCPAVDPAGCPCPDLIRVCPGGGYSSPICRRNKHCICKTTWSPCPAPCPCPAIARLCSDGSSISPICERDAMGVCQTTWPSCPST